MNYDITPETLQEWDKLSGNIQELIESVLTEPRDFSYMIPAGYSRDPEEPKRGIPIKEHIEVLISVLDRVRFKENCTIVEGVQICRAKGLRINNPQSLSNALDRLEGELGLLPELAPSVSAKAKDNRQRLEWRRKRRVNKREADKKKRLKAEQKLLEKELKKQTKKLVQNAKTSKMTADELAGKSVKETIKRLKEESKASKWEAKEEIDKERILFEPTPKQAEFLAASEKVVFYGGAAGGIIKQKQLYSATFHREMSK